MSGKGLWRSIKQCGYLRAVCKNFSRKSGATWMQERPLHQSSHDPLWWLGQWKPSCMCVCVCVFFRFWNNNGEQWRRQATAHANLDTPSAVFNYSSTSYSELFQLCDVCIQKEQEGQIKRVLASYVVAWRSQSKQTSKLWGHPNRGWDFTR